MLEAEYPIYFIRTRKSGMELPVLLSSPESFSNNANLLLKRAFIPESLSELSGGKNLLILRDEEKFMIAEDNINHFTLKAVFFFFFHFFNN